MERRIDRVGSALPGGAFGDEGWDPVHADPDRLVVFGRDPHNLREIGVPTLGTDVTRVDSIFRESLSIFRIVAEDHTVRLQDIDELTFLDEIKELNEL